MIERAAEKKRAVMRLTAALTLIEQEQREPDLWERVHFAYGLTSLFSGAYGLALTDADLSLTPQGERSPATKLPSDPVLDRCNVATLKRALVAAEAEPV